MQLKLSQIYWKNIFWNVSWSGKCKNYASQLRYNDHHHLPYYHITHMFAEIISIFNIRQLVILSETKPTFQKTRENLGKISILFTHQIFQNLPLGSCLHFSNKPAVSWSSGKKDRFAYEIRRLSPVFPEGSCKHTWMGLCRQRKINFLTSGGRWWTKV